MANCASTHDFEGRTLNCSRRNEHPGDHQGKIGPGLTHIWGDGEINAETPVDAPRCDSRFRDDESEIDVGEAPEIFSCELLHGHSGPHRISFSREQGGGYMPWTDAEAMKPDAVIEATVDGSEAVIVLDGTTGAPIADDGDRPALIAPDIHAIEKTLAVVNAELIIAEREKKDTAEEFKRIQNRQNAIVAELVRCINGEQQLPFTVPDVKEEEDDEEDAA